MKRINLFVFYVFGSLCMMMNQSVYTQQQKDFKGRMDGIYRDVILTSDTRDNLSMIAEYSLPYP